MNMKFRESFRGYNRDDVNNYIEQINIRFSKRENELLSQIKNGGSSENASELEKENDQLKQRIALLEEKLANVSESANVKEEITGEKLGNILIMANENAEKLVSDAQNESGRILAEAELKASTIELETARQKEKMLGDFASALESLSKEYLSVCTDAVAESSVKFREAAVSITEKAKALLGNK